MSDKIRAEFEAWAKASAIRTDLGAWDAWQASRLAALEECAQVCEDIGDKYGEEEGGRWPELKSDAQTGARNCESAIRALAIDNRHGEKG